MLGSTLLGSTLRLLLAVAFAPTLARRFVVNDDLSTSTCNGAFNTPCSIATAHVLVDALYDDLMTCCSSTSYSGTQDDQILTQVTSGERYRRPLNFWCVVYDATGVTLASGRPTLPGSGLTDPIGKTVGAVADEEAGFEQAGLWDRIKAAADTGDGYFTFSGFDNNTRLAHTQNSAIRIGFVRKVTVGASGRVLYLSSAFSDVPLVDAFGGQTCTPGSDTLCSISYARQIVGTVGTALLRAETPGRLQEVLA